MVNSSPSLLVNGPISTSRGTRSPSSTWISPAGVRRTPSWPGSRSEPTIPTARRGRSRSRGRRMGERLSWPIIDRTTYRLSIFDEHLLMILTQRLRALRSFARPSPTVLSYPAIRRGPRSRRPDDSRWFPAGLDSAPDAPPSGTVWVIDLRSRAVVATVTGVGNDPYGLTILEGDEN